MDVQTRQNEILTWQNLSQEEKNTKPKPLDLRAGETFKKTFVLPSKSIFWTKGIKTTETGNKFGSGMLNLELLFLDVIGFNLSKNSYALNETIRILIRTIMPFIVFFLVALLTKRVENNQVQNFFVKMKTKVANNPVQDAKELKLSYANPKRFDKLKLFPDTDWEFDKWDKEDVIGFLASVVGVFLVIGVLFLLISIGA